MPDATSPPLDLTADTARHLAVLHGASDNAVETTLALLPLGERVELAAHGFIETEQQDRHSPDFQLTDEGRSAIASCAEWLQHQPGGADAVLPKSVDKVAERLARTAERLSSRVTS